MPPLQIRLFSVVSTGDLKLGVRWTSTRELVANVTSPRLSRLSANFSTKFTAAAFRGAQEPLLVSEVERSITIMTLTSRRVALADARSVMWSRVRSRRNVKGRSTLAVLVIERINVESVAATLVTFRLVESKKDDGKLAAK